MFVYANSGVGQIPLHIISRHLNQWTVWVHCATPSINLTLHLRRSETRLTQANASIILLLYYTAVDILCSSLSSSVLSGVMRYERRIALRCATQSTKYPPTHSVTTASPEADSAAHEALPEAPSDSTCRAPLREQQLRTRTQRPARYNSAGSVVVPFPSFLLAKKRW